MHCFIINKTQNQITSCSNIMLCEKENGKLCATYKSVTEHTRLNINNFSTSNVSPNSLYYYI